MISERVVTKDQQLRLGEIYLLIFILVSENQHSGVYLIRQMARGSNQVNVLNSDL